jgi:excisionase family DNA binding protein
VEPEVLTLRQVAADLGISRQAVQAAIRDGRLVASVIVGRHRRCTRADVDAFLAGREQRRRQGRGRRRFKTSAQDHRDDALFMFIVAYKREHGGRCPTRRDLAEALGQKSTSAIRGRLLRLAADGRIVLEEGESRNIAIPGERWLAPGE